MTAYLRAAELALALPATGTRTSALLRAAVYAGAVRDLGAMILASQGVLDDASAATEDRAGAHAQLGIALTTKGALQGNATMHRQARDNLLQGLQMHPNDLQTSATVTAERKS